MPPPRRNPRRRCNATTQTPSPLLSPHSSSDSDRFQPVKRSATKSRFSLASRRVRRNLQSQQPHERGVEHDDRELPEQLSNDDARQSDSDFELDNAELEHEAAQLEDAEEAIAPDITPSASRRSTSTNVPARKKRHAAARKHTKMEEGTPTTIVDERAISEKQHQLLSQLFDVLDQNDNNRITLSNVMSVADDHGIVYSYDEVRDMIRFWDKSGTETLSKDDFTRLAVEAKFITSSSTTK